MGAATGCMEQRVSERVLEGPTVPRRGGGVTGVEGLAHAKLWKAPQPVMAGGRGAAYGSSPSCSRGQGMREEASSTCSSAGGAVGAVGAAGARRRQSMGAPRCPMSERPEASNRSQGVGVVSVHRTRPSVHAQHCNFLR